MSDWNEFIQKSIADHPTITDHLRQSELAEAKPSVVPLAPGERPTEPGWYVVQRGQSREVMYALPPRGEMMADCYGEFHMPDFITFIARIYPDRIEGREG